MENRTAEVVQREARMLFGVALPAISAAVRDFLREPDDHSTRALSPDNTFELECDNGKSYVALVDRGGLRDDGSPIKRQVLAVYSVQDRGGDGRQAKVARLEEYPADRDWGALANWDIPDE